VPAKGVVVVTTYQVRAKRWAQGWELHIRDVGVTQVRSLARAEQQVRDYLESLLDIDASRVTVDIVPDLGGLEKLVGPARQKTRAAEDAQRKAAEHAREVVRKLRWSGLSVDETAALMGFSAGRVSQMAKKAAPGAASKLKSPRKPTSGDILKKDPSAGRRTRKSDTSSVTTGRTSSRKTG
jgi:hypothetical protein